MTTTRGAPTTGTHETGTVVVSGSAAGFAQQIAVGRHRLSADEPTSAGGTDPYGYLLAALGSCTSMTLLCGAEAAEAAV